MNLEEIKIRSINDILTCINLASSLEIGGWPKPGNVHRTRNFNKTRYEHFLAGIAAIQPIFRRFCLRIVNKTDPKNNDYAFVELGKFFKRAVKKMMKWQYGGNILFGHILILAPLSASACICKKLKKFSLKDFRTILKNIIRDSTVEDTINLYEAIRICHPGGLGKVAKYDLNANESISEIQQDNINLKKIFEFSKHYDLISSEYASGFNIILNEGLPFFIDRFNNYNDINIAIVDSFLKLLSDHPDTLIIRKSGKDEALLVSQAAFKILQNGGISTKKGLNLAIKLDNQLHKAKGKMNPGTSADLIAGIIFSALIFGLKF
ncbi:MAG: triphosphoribosyl-dephospho-CoA synthase [Candidatus Heimdallarchaeota archaeon]